MRIFEQRLACPLNTRKDAKISEQKFLFVSFVCFVGVFLRIRAIRVIRGQARLRIIQGLSWARSPEYLCYPCYLSAEALRDGGSGVSCCLRPLAARAHSFPPARSLFGFLNPAP